MIDPLLEKLEKILDGHYERWRSPHDGMACYDDILERDIRTLMAEVALEYVAITAQH